MAATFDKIIAAVSAVPGVSWKGWGPPEVVQIGNAWARLTKVPSQVDLGNTVKTGVSVVYGPATAPDSAALALAVYTALQELDPTAKPWLEPATYHCAGGPFAVMHLNYGGRLS